MNRFVRTCERAKYLRVIKGLFISTMILAIKRMNNPSGFSRANDSEIAEFAFCST